GAAGDVVADKGGRARFVVGLDGVAEMGATLDVRPGTLATAVASDVNAQRYRGEVMLIPGIQLRVALTKSPEVRAGFLVELGLADIRYQRDVSVSTDTSSFDGTSSSHFETMTSEDDHSLRV